jgi:hypothetical protein
MYTIYHPPYKLLDWIDIDKLNWEELSKNPNAIHLLEQNPEKIDWYELTKNTNAIHLLEQNQDKITYQKWESGVRPDGMKKWEYYHDLSGNPSIFKIDYKQLYKRIEPFHEELMQKCFHPNRVNYYLEQFDYDILEEEYMVVLHEIYRKLYTF